MRHKIGWTHEHKRMDREKWIRILFNPKDLTDSERVQYGVDKTLKLQGTPYDFCSIVHYETPSKFEKLPKYKGLGCMLGQDNFHKAIPSVLDFQELNKMYQCDGYDTVETCADYFK